MGLAFAGQPSSVHRSSARVVLAGPFRRRALYNPNFKASARCGALPPTIPLMSPRTDSAVLLVFNFVSRCFHPITMNSGCLQTDVRIATSGNELQFNVPYRASKPEKVSAAIFSSVNFASMSSNARLLSSCPGLENSLFHGNYTRKEGNIMQS